MPLKKVMIIEDDEVDTYLAKRVLSDNFFAREVVAASSVKEGMEYLSDHKKDFPEIIFLDLNMPEQNGLDFLDAFSAFTSPEKNSTKVILLMNVVNSSDEVTLKASSHPLVRQVIEKPLTEDKLRSISIE